MMRSKCREGRGLSERMKSNVQDNRGSIQKKSLQQAGKFDPYKRTILFFASIINIGLMTLIFAYVWYGYYAATMFQNITFYRKGHYVLLALYGLLLFFSPICTED